MVITSDYYTLYYHYIDLSLQYENNKAHWHAYTHIGNVLSDYLDKTLSTQRRAIEKLIQNLENSSPVIPNMKKVYMEEVKTLKTFLEKTKGEYSE